MLICLELHYQIVSRYYDIPGKLDSVRSAISYLNINKIGPNLEGLYHFTSIFNLVHIGYKIYEKKDVPWNWNSKHVQIFTVGEYKLWYIIPPLH